RRCPRPHQRSQYPKPRSAPALELEDNLSQTRRMKRSSHSDLSCADFPAVLTVRLRLTCGWFKSLVMNLANISPFCSRSRFFVNTVGSHTGSSGESPTNQRYRRL